MANCGGKKKKSLHWAALTYREAGTKSGGRYHSAKADQYVPYHSGYIISGME